jgi:hypothetical protein
LKSRYAYAERKGFVPEALAESKPAGAEIAPLTSEWADEEMGIVRYPRRQNDIAGLLPLLMVRDNATAVASACVTQVL